MTPERLAEIEARAEAAGGKSADTPSATSAHYFPSLSTWQFAYATDIPDLIAEVKRLRRIEARYFGACEETGEEN